MLRQALAGGRGAHLQQVGDQVAEASAFTICAFLQALVELPTGGPISLKWAATTDN
jgi:hypothetical protein